MIFRWLRNRRRKRILRTPFPEAWRACLRDRVRFYRRLDDDERERLERIAQVLVAEKSWEGCGGFAMSDEVKVQIAAQAALLILELEHEYYRSVDSILVYPSSVMVPGVRQTGGVAVETDIAAAGVAYHRGPVVFAWDAVGPGSLNESDGRNVVFHEFAHKLDLLDDYADGTPVLEDREDYRLWTRIMQEEYDRLVRKAKRGQVTFLDKYGATNPAEFFAVATECFFEKPVAMRRGHEALYGLLSAYYRQDPATRLGRS